ncbi:MAG: LysM peptidoglycan-binding domain-containing protein [Anaerolineales bacterium]|jgi:LysM repeat protein
MTISNTIDSYRKRRKKPLPLILGGVAILLVVIGIIILIVTMSKGGFTLFPTKTPTVTITPTPTNTFTPTGTPTITLTPTITPTATASQIYQYVVKEGETLTTIIQSQGLADTPNALVIIYMLNPTIDPITGFITVGQTINLPPPNYPIPSPTPLPTGLAPGANITYRVLPGDSLGSISTKFNTTIASLLLLNKTVLTNGQNSIIYPGQLLIVSINLVTPVPTVKPTATATP